MKRKTAYSKAIKIDETNDLLSFLEWSNISMKYDKHKGLLVTFPENAKNYSYFAIGHNILYISLQIGNDFHTYGSLH